MFIDSITLELRAWKWWDWIISWRREKYIPNWWPWWWDGWHWWHVYIQTSNNINTLSKYRHKKVLCAKNWENWMPQNKHWANWEDLVLEVPVWTIVKEVDTWKVIADLSENNIKFLLLKWWRWWFWNSHFTSSTRQAPNFAEFWDIWESIKVSLELKLVADIWIIWMPSAWKSSLISKITNVKPKIWDYPFTTLIPNLWVLEHKWKSLVLEDVPWLIPWASKWKWLWINFLKHIERTNVLLHLLDLYRLDNIFSDYENIRYELGEFNTELTKKEEIIVFSKWDLLDDEMKDYIKWEFLKKYPDKKVFIISSATWEWIDELKDFLIDNISTKAMSLASNEVDNAWEIKILKLDTDDPKHVDIEYLWDFTFRAKWKRLEQIVRMSDFENKEAVMRVYDVLDKLWVIKKIESKLEKIIYKEDFNNEFFFEWNKDSLFNPKILIWEKELLLEKLKFNL